MSKISASLETVPERENLETDPKRISCFQDGNARARVDGNGWQDDASRWWYFWYLHVYWYCNSMLSKTDFSGKQPTTNNQPTTSFLYYPCCLKIHYRVYIFFYIIYFGLFMKSITNWNLKNYFGLFLGTVAKLWPIILTVLNSII